jgi:hypothetical protein
VEYKKYDFESTFFCLTDIWSCALSKSIKRFSAILELRWCERLREGTRASSRCVFLLDFKGRFAISLLELSSKIAATCDELVSAAGKTVEETSSRGR